MVKGDNGATNNYFDLRDIDYLNESKDNIYGPEVTLLD